MNTLYGRALRSAAFGFVWFFAVIFVPAWTLDYWQGWAFYLTTSGLATLAYIYIALRDKALLERRLGMGPAAETTRIQKVITALGGLVYVAAIVVSVLDHRLRWSFPVPASLSIAADALGAFGILIFVDVVRVNSFAASTVKTVDGQVVVSTGPYALVRHPMYSGAILTMGFMPLALGSWWGMLFAPLFVLFFAWRLLDEERLLRKELAGYEAYTERVRYRLLPGVW